MLYIAKNLQNTMFNAID